MKETSLSPPEQWILKGIPFLFLIGGLLHFAYQLLGQNVVVGLFAPVNESVWEHTKMLLLPMIAWWTVYYAVFGRAGAINADQWFTAALMALLTALLVMPMLFYFYTGAFGVELLWVDVLILLVALVAGQLLGLHVYRYGQHYLPASVAIGLLAAILVIFIVFTFVPPTLPIFCDSVSGQYRIGE